MQSHVYWVRGLWRGKLGILARPRGGDWLADEAAAWREAGIDVVISLLQPDEEAQLALDSEASVAAAQGIDFRSFPIPDRGVPASREAVAELAHSIVERLESGKSVAVHCRQGIGRSSLIVGSALLAAGQDVAIALKAIMDSRGIDVPETDEQRQWFRDFASWLSLRRAAQHAAAIDERRGSD